MIREQFLLDLGKTLAGLSKESRAFLSPVTVEPFGYTDPGLQWVYFGENHLAMVVEFGEVEVLSIVPGQTRPGIVSISCLEMRCFSGGHWQPDDYDWEEFHHCTSLAQALHAFLSRSIMHEIINAGYYADYLEGQHPELMDAQNWQQAFSAGNITLRIGEA